MKFTDITKAIDDLWTFSWPPIVLLLILYFVSHYLNAEGSGESLTWLTGMVKQYGLRLNEIKDILEPYGLNKLVPVISAIAVIGILYLLNGPVTIVAHNLPPHITYRPDYVVERMMSDEEKLVLIRKFPTAASFNSAYYRAVHSYKPVEVKPGGGRARLNHKIDIFIKFAVLAAVILLIVNVKSGSSIFSQLGKLVLFFIYLVPIWCINFVILLKKQEQQYFVDWHAVRVKLLEDSQSLIKPDATKDEQKKISAFRENRGKLWWKIYFFDPNFKSWFKHTFIPGNMS